MPTSVPFFRPKLSDAAIAEVEDTLRSGWLTTGPKVKRFEAAFAEAVGAEHSLAVNSCTAAMHLALEALDVGPGQAVLIPTMTFAATAAVVRHMGGTPILVDCEPATGNLDLADAAAKADAFERGSLPVSAERLVGIMPVHVGGHMVDMGAVRAFADQRGLWVVEDAAHAFPAAYRAEPDAAWQQAGQGTADVTCFSFYANKTITTGEGGMAVSPRDDLMERMRVMSLHGLSKDAWKRYSGGHWDYRVISPGFKYNLTDIAAAIGLHQLERAEELRLERQAVANRYAEQLGEVSQLQLPVVPADRIHSWHLYPLRLRLDQLKIDRNAFIDALTETGISTSVHWRPLHAHPAYESLGWLPEHLPAASAVWQRLVTLPLFPGMREDEVESVVAAVTELCRQHAR